MATIDNYKIVLDVQGQQAVDRLSKSLGGLGSTIAGIGFGAFTASVLNMADAITDLASATGLAIGEIAGFQAALGQAGGKASDASKMISSFFQQVDKAATGSEEAQKALQKVGISFNDLGNLSERDLLSTALNSLKEMGPGAERTAAGMAVLGKAFRNIDPKVLADAFSTGDFSKAEAALLKMGNLADSLAANMYTLQMAGAQVFSDMLTSIEPFIGKLEEGRLSFEQAEKIVKAVGVALGIAFAAKTVATIIDIVTVVKSLTTALRGTVIAQTALTALQGPRGWAMIAAGALATTAAIVGFNKALDDTDEKVGDLTGNKPSTGGSDTSPKRATQFYSDSELQARKQALTIAQQTTYQQTQQNKQAQDYQRIINSTIGLMSDEADIIKLNASLEQDAANKILDLNKQIETEKSKGRSTNQAIITELEKQKQQVNDNLIITKQLKQEELEKLRVLQEQKLAFNYFTDAYTQQNNSLQKSIDLITQRDVITGKISEEEASRIMRMGALETDFANKRIALQNQLETATTQIDKDIINAKISDLKKYENLAKHQLQESIKLEEQKRDSTIAGVKSAMDQIEKSMDPFNLAQQATLGLFNKINDSIHELVTTGRTSFKDLANGFGQMIVEMMLKQQVAKAASAATGWLDTLFSGLFKAEGGPVKGNQPYIVGEKGPELFVPPGAGKIIPNNQMPTKGVASGAISAPVSNTYITNNISAIDAKSVAQLFAENRRTLFGSVQLAQKELSYGR